MEAVQGWDWEPEIEKAQKHIAENYSPEVIADKWARVFGSLA